MKKLWVLLLSVCLGLGTLVAQDYKAQFDREKARADKGYAEAQNNVGYLYDAGLGVRQDRQEAVKWYRLAANQGFDQAQLNLAICYELGDGVRQDYNLAYMWAHLAYLQGLSISPPVRKRLAQQLSSRQIANAEELAYKWNRLTPTERRNWTP